MRARKTCMRLQHAAFMRGRAGYISVGSYASERHEHVWCPQVCRCLSSRDQSDHTLAGHRQLHTGSMRFCMDALLK